MGIPRFEGEFSEAQRLSCRKLVEEFGTKFDSKTGGFLSALLRDSRSQNVNWGPLEIGQTLNRTHLLTEPIDDTADLQYGEAKRLWRKASAAIASAVYSSELARMPQDPAEGAGGVRRDLLSHRDTLAEAAWFTSIQYPDALRWTGQRAYNGPMRMTAAVARGAMSVTLGCVTREPPDGRTVITCSYCQAAGGAPAAARPNGCTRYSHALHGPACQGTKGFQTRRHHDVRDHVYNFLDSFGAALVGSVSKEPVLQAEPREVRADIQLTQGGSVFNMDVVIAHPPSYVSTIADLVPGYAASKAAASKRSHYADFLPAEDLARLLPIAIESSGRLDDPTLQFLKGIASKDNRRGPQKLTHLLYNINATIARYNGLMAVAHGLALKAMPIPAAPMLLGDR
jgi:hypothetical protein